MTIQITREDIQIRVLASGAKLSFPVFRFLGEPGPRIYIQANIHGPEIAGIGAIHELMRILRQQAVLHGSLTIVPSVNPVALDTKINGKQVGYADLNETEVGNFNRIYQMLVTDTQPDHSRSPHKVALDSFVQQHLGSDIETIKRAFRAELKAALDRLAEHRAVLGPNHGQKLAMHIQRMAYDADTVIDLHTAGDATYHLYTFAECTNAAVFFDLRHMLLLDDSFSGVLDESFLQPWLRLRKAFAGAGREIPFEEFQLEAFTPELASADTLERESMQVDAGRIVNYLRYRGVMDGEAVVPDGAFYACAHDDYARYRAPTGGLLLWEKHPGDPVKAGDTLVTILRTYTEQSDETADSELAVNAVSDGIMLTRASSRVVHEGMPLCSVMTHVNRVR